MDTNNTDSPSTFSHLAGAVIHVFEKKDPANTEPKINVNRFVSELAAWYEKLRNAMDYRDDEVVLRAAIERILKRRLLINGNPSKIAEPLVRELIWARYFQSGTVPESMVHHVSSYIMLYMELKQHIHRHGGLKEVVIDEWILQLLSCQIARLLSPNIERNTVSNFMYHLLKDSLVIEDDSEDTKSVQLYLAVRRAFAKDDIAFLRFYMFEQIFGKVTSENVLEIGKSFIKGYREIEHQLHYPLKEKIYLYIKRLTPIFFILEDILEKHRKNIPQFATDPEFLEKSVLEACEIRYKSIGSRVRRAIIRSVVFLIVTKAIIALGIEGTYERIRYGKIMWATIGLNTGIPPVLMIVVSLFIRVPGKDNSMRILGRIRQVLFENDPKLSYELRLRLHPPRNSSILMTVFATLWFVAFIVSFGLIIYLLNLLHFNIVSQFIFIFFITIVSFLSYRINSVAHMYMVDGRQGLLTPFIDFLFIPIVRVGMRLTEGISQINFVIFIFDFLIEAPFKAIFGFFEQWFTYMHAKREDLG